MRASSLLNLVRQGCVKSSICHQIGAPNSILSLATSSLSSAASGFGGKGSSSSGSGQSGGFTKGGNLQKGDLRSPLSGGKRMNNCRDTKAAAMGARTRTRTRSDIDRVSNEPVKHDRAAKRFTLDLGNNQLARIDYRPIGADDLIDMYHSEVPVQLRGRGIGQTLARGALEQAAKENLRVKLTCTYLIDFINRSSTDPKLKRSVVAKSGQSTTEEERR